MRIRLSSSVAVLAVIGFALLPAVPYATAQSAPAFADSLGRWATEIAVVDAAAALAVSEVESVRDCATDGVTSLAVSKGFDGISESTAPGRLYFEITVLEDVDGFSAYLTLAVRDSNGRLLHPVEGIETEVWAEDSGALCEAVRKSVATAKIPDL